MHSPIKHLWRGRHFDVALFRTWERTALVVWVFGHHLTLEIEGVQSPTTGARRWS